MDYNKKLINDSTGAQQDWYTVEYPKDGNGNTTKYTEQTYLSMNDGTLYDHLQHQSNKHKSAFLTGAMDIIEWTPT